MHVVKVLRQEGPIPNFSDLRAIVAEGEQLYGFYSTLVLEAFQHEAETGSIRAVEWVMECAQNLNNLKDLNEQYEILVAISLIFYNFARDARYRYGITAEAENRFEVQYMRFKTLVEQYNHYNIKQNEKNYLKSMTDLILLAFISNGPIPDRDRRLKVLSTASSTLNRAKVDNCFPDLLIGLFAYHYARLRYQSTENQVRWYSIIIEYYSKATEHLSIYANDETSLASYFYDVVFGKLPLWSVNMAILKEFY